MKHILIALLLTTPAFADGMSEEEFNLRGDMKEGTASAAALASIDFDGDSLEFGVAASNYGGDQGHAAAISVPLGRHLRAVVGAFGGPRLGNGWAASVVMGF